MVFKSGSFVLIILWIFLFRDIRRLKTRSNVYFYIFVLLSLKIMLKNMTGIKVYCIIHYREKLCYLSFLIDCLYTIVYLLLLITFMKNITIKIFSFFNCFLFNKISIKLDFKSMLNCSINKQICKNSFPQCILVISLLVFNIFW